MAAGARRLYVPSKLEVVSFKNMTFSTTWFDFFTRSIPSLRQLQLDRCKLFYEDEYYVDGNGNKNNDYDDDDNNDEDDDDSDDGDGSLQNMRGLR